MEDIPAKILCFMHIPKNAGTSFTAFLRSKFDDNEYDIHYSNPKLYRTNPPKPQHRLICGHLPFHFIKKNLNNPTIITFLRHPFARVSSTYYFLKNADGHPFQKEVAQNASLLDFLNNPKMRKHYTNVQTRYLINHFYYFDDEDNLLERENEYLQIAKKHLAELAFVGLVEKYEASLELLAHKFKWQLPETSKKQVLNKSKKPSDEIIDEVKKAIIKHNRLDLQLYEFGEQLFMSHYNETFGTD